MAEVAEVAEMAEMADVGIDEDELDEELDWFDDDEVYAETEDEELDEIEVEEDEVDGAEDTLIEDDSGWLPDPDVEGQERFWDGTEWTEHVRPMEEEPDFGALYEVYAEEDDDVEVDEVELDEDVVEGAEDDALIEDDDVDEVDLEEDVDLIEVEAGWFPDPGVEGQERFWDGTEWTDHVRPTVEEPEFRALHEVDTDEDDEVEVDKVELDEDEVEDVEVDALIEDDDVDEVDLEEDVDLIEDESGWFPDPGVEGQERFWDGTEWTDHVRPMEEEPDILALYEEDDEEDDDDLEVGEIEVDEVELEEDEVDEIELDEDEVESADDDALIQDDDVDEVDLEEDVDLIEVESGWFPDPGVEGQERFWDGTEWTDHVRPMVEEPEFRALYEVDAEGDDEDAELLGAGNDALVDNDEVRAKTEVEEINAEGDGVEGVKDEALLTTRSEDDALIDDDESGWLSDPDVEGQERFWDGTEWTDHVRPLEDEPDFRVGLGIPDHVPELQRALAAATADINDVEARLSILFDRGAGKSKRGRGVAEPAGSGNGAAATGPLVHEEFVGNPSTQAGDDPIHMGRAGTGEFSGDDEGAFAELDAALVAEEPEKVERRFFKRRS